MNVENFKKCNVKKRCVLNGTPQRPVRPNGQYALPAIGGHQPERCKYYMYKYSAITGEGPVQATCMQSTTLRKFLVVILVASYYSKWQSLVKIKKRKSGQRQNGMGKKMLVLTCNFFFSFLEDDDLRYMQEKELPSI